MRNHWKTIQAPLFGAALLALLLAAPLAAVQQPADETGEPRVELHENVKIKRVILSPHDGDGLRMVRIPVEGEVGKQMKVKVVTPGEDGDVQTFEWNGEDGEMVRLGENVKAIFVNGVPRGFLGVQLTDLTPELRTHFGTVEDRGVLVARVLPDSPAARAGLRVGDVLTHVDGQAVESSSGVTRRLADRKEGEVVGLEVLREGRVETLAATLEVRERPQVEVGEILRKLEEAEGFQFEFDTEALERQMEKVHEYFESEEWQKEMEQMKVDLRRQQDLLEVELRELEEHLQELDGEQQEERGESP